jgi:hypothetical protein
MGDPLKVLASVFGTIGLIAVVLGSYGLDALAEVLPPGVGPAVSFIVLGMVFFYVLRLVIGEAVAIGVDRVRHVQNCHPPISLLGARETV